MQTDAQRKAKAKWHAKNLTNVAACLRREVAEDFKDAAKRDGTTPNELIRTWVTDYINRKVTEMTNEQIQAIATIFAICRKATGARGNNDIDNAQRYPLREATIMINKLHAMGKATSEVERQIAEQYAKVDVDTFRANFDKCLTLEQQGVWQIAYFKAMGNDQK